ncbi:MAG: hypothetical protein U5M50_04945 [Sphingobium sp.]|nr:hypothetical protein [Sphingobium sp.]
MAEIEFTPEQMLLRFTPVPLARTRSDGWTSQAQERFISALAAFGSIGQACRAVGMSRNSAYKLRARAGAEDFRHAWDRALNQGRTRMFAAAMERALDGYTTIRIQKGGSITLETGVERHLMMAVLREPPPPKVDQR